MYTLTRNIYIRHKLIQPLYRGSQLSRTDPVRGGIGSGRPVGRSRDVSYHVMPDEEDSST